MCQHRVHQDQWFSFWLLQKQEKKLSRAPLKTRQARARLQHMSEPGAPCGQEEPPFEPRICFLEINHLKPQLKWVLETFC